jgi:hypothetical protein
MVRASSRSCSALRVEFIDNFFRGSVKALGQTAPDSASNPSDFVGQGVPRKQSANVVGGLNPTSILASGSPRRNPDLDQVRA